LNKAEIKTVRPGVGLPNLRVLRIYFANALIYTTIVFTSQETAPPKEYFAVVIVNYARVFVVYVGGFVNTAAVIVIYARVLVILAYIVVNCAGGFVISAHGIVNGGCVSVNSTLGGVICSDVKVIFALNYLKLNLAKYSSISKRSSMPTRRKCRANHCKQMSHEGQM
jgi:hypothetical protein